ncbi:zinc finger, CCHC-type containing protein [Tanacetum coccineum]
MFRLNIVNDNIDSAFMSTSKLNDSILWHARLGHVYFKRMQDMSKDGLILALNMDTEKTELRVLGAVVRLPNQKLNTLGERGIECIFVGYVEHSKAFRSSLVPRPSLRIHNGTEEIGGDEVFDQQSYCFNVEDDPKTFDEAMKSQDVAFWKEAINDEMNSIMGNNTWVLVDLPLGCKPLGCKWIFKRKLKVDGTIEKFKARLVIQGFRQKSRIYYFDTYARVVCISTIRLLITLALIHNLIIHQIDVKTTFLNDALHKEVYMNQPQGFIMPGNENKLCKLIKSLYGLKQAPKQWYKKFDEVVLSSGYLLNQANKFQVDLTKEFLSSRFSMKDMGEADVILGIRIKHESNGITFSQSHYIEKVVSQLEYSTVIGCLMYVMTYTRPDIAFAVVKVSRYTNNPGTQHWKEIQRINNTEDNSSTNGRVFLLGGGEISWASKKQTYITNSTMKSEFVALAVAGKEDEWLRNLILNIPLWSKSITLISIRCDSAATLIKAYNQIYNGKSRHLGVRHNIIREHITNGVVSIEFLRSQQNLTDHLTKGLARDLILKSAEGIEKYDPELNILVKTLLFLNAKVVDVPEGGANVEQSTETPSAHVVASESPQRTKQTKASIHQDLSVANVEKRKQANVEEDKGEEAKAKAEKPQVVYRSNPKSSSSKKRKNAEYEVTVQILKKTKADCDKQTIRKGLRKKDEHIDYCLVDEETSVKKVNKKGKGKGQVKLKRNTSCLTLIIRYEFLDPYMESILNDFKVDSHRVDDMLGIPMGGIPLLSLEEICGGRDPFAMDWFAQLAPSCFAIFDLEPLTLSLDFIQRISLTGFPAQSVRSSNANALDSPYLLVLNTRTSQSRQHDMSESDSYYLSD